VAWKGSGTPIRESAERNVNNVRARAEANVPGCFSFCYLVLFFFLTPLLPSKRAVEARRKRKKKERNPGREGRGMQCNLPFSHSVSAETPEVCSIDEKKEKQNLKKIEDLQVMKNTRGNKRDR
jgi:hypothetical protein